MPVEIVMPKLGLTMTEGMIVDWNFKEGDAVNQGDILFVLETEKVTYEVEAPASGILAKILTQGGETVPVGTVIGYLAEEGEEIPDLPQGQPPDVEAAADTSSQVVGKNRGFFLLLAFLRGLCLSPRSGSGLKSSQ